MTCAHAGAEFPSPRDVIAPSKIVPTLPSPLRPCVVPSGAVGRCFVWHIGPSLCFVPARADVTAARAEMLSLLDEVRGLAQRSRAPAAASPVPTAMLTSSMGRGQEARPSPLRFALSASRPSPSPLDR